MDLFLIQEWSSALAGLKRSASWTRVDSTSLFARPRSNFSTIEIDAAHPHRRTARKVSGQANHRGPTTSDLDHISTYIDLFLRWNGFPINPTQTFCLMLQGEPSQNRVAGRGPESAAERFVAQKHSNGQNEFSLVVRSYEKRI